MNERKIIITLTYISGIIVAAVLIGLWRYGVDLSTVFLGTPWKSSLTYGRGAMALEGAIVFVTIFIRRSTCWRHNGTADNDGKENPARAARSNKEPVLKVLVVGGGAREHTLVWKLAQSPKVKEIYAAPGNAGTARLAHNLDIAQTDIEALLKAARDLKIDLTVVGPEAPLADGIADRFLASGLPIFGATKAAAEIESSKIFAKELMQKYDIPCARSASFSDYNQAREYLQKQTAPIVIKADGLAAGKGVIVAAINPGGSGSPAQPHGIKSTGGGGREGYHRRVPHRQRDERLCLHRRPHGGPDGACLRLQADI